MAMINCPTCGHAMSSTAAACPNCGHVMTGAPGHTPVAATREEPVRRKRVGAGRWLAGLFFLALIVLIALWYFDLVNFV